jgi:hypothetical protein
MTAVTAPAANPAEWLRDPMVSPRRAGHVRLAMSRHDLRRTVTASAVRGVQDGRTGRASMARWENEGGALLNPKDREPLIGVHDTSSA